MAFTLHRVQTFPDITARRYFSVKLKGCPPTGVVKLRSLNHDAIDALITHHSSVNYFLQTSNWIFILKFWFDGDITLDGFFSNED